MSDKLNQNLPILILLASGFEEETAVSCMSHLRSAGLPVSLVGLSSGTVRGLHGLTIQPDQTLTELPKDKSAKMIIVPGNGQCTNALLMSPRFHQLIANTIDNQGYVVTGNSAENALKNAGIPQRTPAPQYIIQGNKEVCDFADELVDLAK